MLPFQEHMHLYPFYFYYVHFGYIHLDLEKWIEFWLTRNRYRLCASVNYLFFFQALSPLTAGIILCPLPLLVIYVLNQYLLMMNLWVKQFHRIDLHQTGKKRKKSPIVAKCLHFEYRITRFG